MQVPVVPLNPTSSTTPVLQHKNRRNSEKCFGLCYTQISSKKRVCLDLKSYYYRWRTTLIPSSKEAIDSPVDAIPRTEKDCFEKPAFLTVSSQLNVETYATALSGDIKAFYMRLNDYGKTVAAMDMLVPWVIFAFIFYFY
ncbi:hypothetical protein L1987_48960 [Smallanthus sonchifolius]|uniref:Uncharacterized protein n=1 Tax=Smallanthus sonchifolius TaxID=185202 RepID=A0ACB9FTE9_9ASTR|nr:hypothetical protein L1987_48960 [Smallanthus sonchifolius]